MSEIGTARSVIDSYDENLRFAYASVCGDEGSYEAIKDDFIRSLEGPPLNIIASGAGNGAAAENYLRQYLGNGEGCHETSFLNTVKNHTASVQTAKTPQQSYESWQELLRQYTDSVEDLPFQFDNIKTFSHIGMTSRRNIMLSFRRIEIIMNEIEKLLMGRLEEETADTRNEIITAQLEVFYGLKYAIDKAMDTIEPLPNQSIQISYGKTKRRLFQMRKDSLITDPRVSRWLLQKAWRDFSNPLHWLNEVYVQRVNKKNVGIKVNFDQEIPDVVFWNPQLVKELIDRIILTADKYGTHQKPMFLEMSWDMYSQLLLISTRDVMKIVQDTAWQKVQELIDELRTFWGVDNTNSTVFVHLPLLDISLSDPPVNQSSGLPPPPAVQRSPQTHRLINARRAAIPVRTPAIRPNQAIKMLAVRNLCLRGGMEVFVRSPAFI